MRRALGWGVCVVLAVGLAAGARAQEGHQPPAVQPAAGPVRLNTLGYLPGAAKQASVAAPCSTFAVVRASDGARVFEGSAGEPVRNEDTGEALATLDFSAVTEPGEYFLDVGGVGKSDAFVVADDLYREPFRLVARGMYLWRCGCPVHGEHDGQTYAHAACHLDDGHLDFVWEAEQRQAAEESPSPGPSHQGRGEKKDGVGGWHDAGDFNKYVVNAGVTVGCMFRAWEDFQGRIEGIGLGNQGGVGSQESGVGKTEEAGVGSQESGVGKKESSEVLPESRLPTPDSSPSNGSPESRIPTPESSPFNGSPDSRLPNPDSSLPDFLAELKYEVDWLFSMQADDGSVYHKLSALHFCGFIPPEAEHDPRYFAPWSSAATADFVAMMAAASRHFRPYDPAYADRCLAAARKSYAFLQAHPEDHQADLRGFNTGGYGAPDWDDRLWAAAELWEATGDADVLADFEARARSAEPQRRWWRRDRNQDDDDDEGNRPPVYQWHVAADWDWGNTKNLGLLTYLESERPGRDAELVTQIRESLLETADRIVATRDGHGYARPLGGRYYWGCNGTVARQVVVLEAARRMVDRERVAGGERSESPGASGAAGGSQSLDPRHRADNYKAASLDALNHLLGRNVHGRSYVTGLGDRPPMKPHDRRSASDANADPWPGYLVGGPHPGPRDWFDDEGDYRTNEIAINWNGALIYALAAAMDEPARD